MYLVTKEIKLKTKYGYRVILLDDEDYDFVISNNIRLTIQNAGRKHSYARYYIYKNGKRKSVLLHRIIMKCPKNKVIDHINHDTFDNRKSNLRIVTHRTNSCNMKTNTSGVPGVGYHKATKKWRAYYNKNNKHISLGYYNTKQEAIQARKVVGW